MKGLTDVFLLPLRVGPAPSSLWQRQLSGALRTAASIDPRGRVLLYLLGAPSDGPAVSGALSPELVTLLSRAYDCIPPEAPRLDLVPLLAAADWELTKAATLGHITSLLMPPDDAASASAGDGGASVADAVRLICEARREAGLHELSVCSAAELGVLPPHHDASSAAGALERPPVHSS